MTYCLGIVTQSGIVMASDSRTHAGVDHVSTYRKLFDFSNPGERVIVITTSGNLSITQGVIACLKKDLHTPNQVNIHNLSTMYDVARYVGSKLREMEKLDRPSLEADRIDYHASFLVGGQIKGEDPELYLVYTQGNCIKAMPETPFLQTGETKYGKPILDRVLRHTTPVEKAARCALLSMDSTLKSNISVGPPIHLIMYHADTFELKHKMHLPLRDPYLIAIRQYWEGALQNAFEQMPEIDWEHDKKLAISQESFSSCLLHSADFLED
ncbi:MAG: proteasome-type protease [Gloeobacterales cyanobacterium]